MAPQAKIKLALSTTRRHIGGIEVHLHAFLTTILDAEERFKRRERTPVPTEEERWDPDRVGEQEDLLRQPGFEFRIF